MNEKHTFGDFVVTRYQVGEIHGYDVYLNGKRIPRAGRTLEEAIVVGIAHKYDGANSQAAHYFFKMIGVKLPGDE